MDALSSTPGLVLPPYASVFRARSSSRYDEERRVGCDTRAPLKDSSAIGFDDAFQYEDFTKPWSERSIAVTANFEPQIGLQAYKTWEDKTDRHPY